MYLSKTKAPALVFYLSILVLFSCEQREGGEDIQITLSQNVIEMGRSIHLEARLDPDQLEEGMIFLPFVNGKRWGAHEFADGEGRASFQIPLPNPGPAVVQVLALPPDREDWMGLEDYRLLQAGTFMPEAGLRSNTLLVLSPTLSG